MEAPPALPYPGDGPGNGQDDSPRPETARGPLARLLAAALRVLGRSPRKRAANDDPNIYPLF